MARSSNVSTYFVVIICTTLLLGRHSFDTGLFNVVPPTLSFATRTCPSRPRYTSITLPRGQFRLDVSGRSTSTTSPTWKSLSALNHFLHAVSPGSHSRIERCQKCRTNFWIRRHRLFGFKLCLVNGLLANFPPTCPFRTWFGVKKCHILRIRWLID